MISSLSNLARTLALVASASLHVVVLGAGGLGGRSSLAIRADARAAAPRDDAELQIDLEPSPEAAAAAETDDHLREEANLPSSPPAHARAYAPPLDHAARPHEPSAAPRAAGRPAVGAPGEAAGPAPLPGPAEPTAVATSTATTPRAFTLPTLRAGTGGGPTSARAGAAGEASGARGGAGSDGAPIAEAQASVPARRVSGANPSYPERARAAEVEATVDVELVVGVDGGVREARVTRAVGYGLDEAAVAAVKGWRFSPAQRGGANVAVRMRWSVSFELR